MRQTPLALALALVLASGCGGDDGTTAPPGNQPPGFREAPRALPPYGSLLSVVPGDRISFSARGIDPDVEEVRYRWEVVREQGGDWATAPDAGNLIDGDTATPVWTVGQLEAPVRVRCLLFDAQDSVEGWVGRESAPGTPVEDPAPGATLRLDAAGSPWVVQGGLVVTASSRLELGPGAVVQVRPQLVTQVDWRRQALRIEGTLVAEGELQSPVILRGGFSANPGSGVQQFRGIEVADPGRVQLTHLRVDEAETGLRVISPARSVVESSSFQRCLTGVQIERGDSTTLHGCVLEENSVGLQLNSAGAVVEDCTVRDNSLYGIDVDASSGDASLLVTGTGFGANLQAHLRLSGEFGRQIACTVRGSNLLPIPGGAPSVNLASSCSLYQLELRGNYWGPVAGPADIRDGFAGDQVCGAGVMEWSDSDCEEGPTTCDWSAEPW